LSMRFADLDALVITGKATRPSCLVVGSRTLEVKDVHYLSADRSGGGEPVGHGCINVDTYRHFGRLGGGAVMGAKNLKAIVILGDESFGYELPGFFAENLCPKDPGDGQVGRKPSPLGG